jgi:hydroxymethylpyrimidine pyrophosphatase-like HAD family hydrolase
LPAGGSKAEGIEKVIEHLGTPSERQVAFGDALNDLEMLKQIEHSFAMGNGMDQVKHTAKYITTRVDEDGIYNGLKQLNLI